MVMIGDNIKRLWHIKNAGTIDADEFYSERLGETILYHARVLCPHCHRNHMPFRLKDRRLVFKGYSYPWCGVDHQDVSQHYTAICPKTRLPYQVEVRFPQ